MGLQNSGLHVPFSEVASLKTTRHERNQVHISICALTCLPETSGNVGKLQGHSRIFLSSVTNGPHKSLRWGLHDNKGTVQATASQATIPARQCNDDFLVDHSERRSGSHPIPLGQETLFGWKRGLSFRKRRGKHWSKPRTASQPLPVDQQVVQVLF